MLAAVEAPQIANVDEEAALLGALMHERSLIDPVGDILTAEHFFEPLHGRIFSAILHLHSQGKPANPFTLPPFFEGDEAMQQLGGAASYLAQLTGSGLNIYGAKDFARDILALAHRRKLVEGLRETITKAHNPKEDVTSLAASVEETLSGVSDAAITAKELSAAQAITIHLDAIEQGLSAGVTSGIDSLDVAMGPVRPGDLQIIAGRPGMGKSILGMSIAKGAAQAGHGVLFVSLEMKAEQLGMRLAADLCFNGHSGINFVNIERGELTSEQFRLICRARDQIADLPLEISVHASLRIGLLNSLIRRWKRRMAARGQKLELVIVDYLQLLDADRGLDNRVQEITQISRGLKSAALANDVGMVALAQLSRKVEEREEKRPKLSDLRESGSIEQDADGVLFLYRPEYYLLQTEPPEDHERREKWEAAMQKVAGDIEFICAKRRQGQTGIRHGRFFGCFQAVR